MGRTQNFRRQHKEIQQVVSEISDLLSIEGLSTRFDDCRDLLAELTEKLTLHLTIEDKAMYPRLLNHTDGAVRTLAQRYVTEMGGIKKVYVDYVGRWPTGDAIRSRAPAFIEETQGVFKALAERIAKEDTELYPLVDKHG